MMRNTFYRLTIFFLNVGLLAACAIPQAAVPQPAPGQVTVEAANKPAATLTVLTHDSFGASERVIAEFEKANGAKITFIKSGDAGMVLNKAILSKESPLADVIYGVDNTFLTRALESGIFEAYQSPLLAEIPEEFKLDMGNQVAPVDYGDVCINYDKAWFAKKGLALPQKLADLLKPEYKGLLVVENPAVSSPGLAFMLSTVNEFGAGNFMDYWKELRQNGVVVVNDWETAYYTNFSGSSGKGGQPMVVSYNSSPVAEVVFADPAVKEAPTASILGPNTCFRQVEFVGILKGRKNLLLAQKFVDFMLSVPFQEDMPLQMFVYPVNRAAKLPAEYGQYAPLPDQPARLKPEDIGTNREKWIQSWQEVVLR